MTFLNIFYSFILYSFLGWIIETTFVSINRKQFVNMGFLDGPFSPIYGSGALAVILLVFPLHHNFFLFFTMSIIVASIIEYITSLFFEKFFNITWWDYSNKPLNIQGRICLEYSFYWGILSALVLTFIHPRIIPFVNFLSDYIGLIGIIIFAIYFVIDATDTFKDLLRLKKTISQKISRRIISNKKIYRLINSFPDFKSKINNDFVIKLKTKIRSNYHRPDKIHK
ncbi:MAG: putative ABC transporter permease [Candidatus Shapirobacteria bacterium]|nr:putative ABC transporter permease [Candidatus Shapirobacteria bacterium]MDD3002607.1 putative ABC transporter permease [Candidatus Shapirobacteria bacterium]MDD4382804.1 putative ABC transporter permease [Candidatus Shapirobacteria bacterium]